MMNDDSRARFYEIRNAYVSDVATASAAVAADGSLLEVRSGLGETVLHWLVVEDDLAAELFVAIHCFKLLARRQRPIWSEAWRW